MADAREDAEVERLWTEFHRRGNMTGQELRTWLLTAASGPDAVDLAPPGRGPKGEELVRILDKRRTDLTREDMAVMRDNVEAVDRLLATPRPDDDRWRRDLMDLGHDPMKPDSPRGGEEPGTA